MRPAPKDARVVVMNSTPTHVDVKVQTIQDEMEEVVDFHAVAPAAFIVNDFVEEVSRGEVDCVMPRVVLGEVFPGAFGQVVFLQEAEKG